MAKKKTSLEIIHPHAAGIDVGSRSHFVAIGQNAEDVKEFGVYNEALHALTEWLLQIKITSVAMESTGTYWQSLFSTLQQEFDIYKSLQQKIKRCDAAIEKLISGYINTDENKKTPENRCQAA